jgi:ribonucleoside-diphosphate reductase alpha chain
MIDTLGVNALRVLNRRYALKDETGKVIETPEQVFRRVAKAVASADLKYGTDAQAKGSEQKFFEMMTALEFLPNSPTLMNAGTDVGQLSACFVLPVEDSIVDIFDAVKNMAVIHQSGGGTGFSFSKLRPEGDIVVSTKGIASGPVSFMNVFDTATEVIKQGGRRRGANMGILRCDHPDIVKFITAKKKNRVLRNFNLSVAVTDVFMKKAAEGGSYDLINPRTGKTVKSMRAADVFDLIVQSAWESGDPGLIFIDEINRKNQTAKLGPIESTNPCGEQILHPYESCNLGSINLSKVINDGALDSDKLHDLVRAGVHFLDNVIDVNIFPVRQTEEITLKNRRIGLGVMGFADALLLLGIPYDSQEALDFATHVMKFIRENALDMSREIAKSRGSFPNFDISSWRDNGYDALRNATVTTIAPTGTISIVAGTTSGIEPLFAISYVRDVMEGTRLMEANPVFEALARERGFYSEELMTEIARTGSVQENKKIPEDVRRLFVTAMDIDPEWHVRMQAAFQVYTDNAVSKTINLRPEAVPDDIRKSYLLAYELRCKGITVYRYGSKNEQVLYLNPAFDKQPEKDLEFATAKPEFSGGCPVPVCPA